MRRAILGGIIYHLKLCAVEATESAAKYQQGMKHSQCVGRQSIRKTEIQLIRDNNVTSVWWSETETHKEP